MMVQPGKTEPADGSTNGAPGGECPLDLREGWNPHEVLRAIDTALGAGVCITDQWGTLVNVSTGWCRIYGVTPEQVLGRSFTLVVPEDARAAAQATHDAFIAGEIEEVPTEWTVQHSDGRPLQIRTGASRFLDHEGKVFKVTTVEDITALRAAQEDAAASQAETQRLTALFTVMLERTTDYIYFKDRKQRFLAASQRLARLTGHAHWRDMLGKTDHDVFTPDLATAYEHEEQRLLDGQTPMLDLREPYVRPDGEKGWVITRKWPLVDEAGAVSGVFGISRDISDMVTYEQAMQRANDLFATAESLTGVGSWDWDIRKDTCSVSENARAILDLPGTTVRGSVLRRCIHPDDWPKVAQAIRTAMTDGTFRVEIRLAARDDGLVRHVQAHGVVMPDQTGQPRTLRGAARDITEMKATQTLKEDIERITRHDLRSPVAATMSGIEILRINQNALSAEQRDVLDMMERSLKRSLNIINASHVLYRIESGTYKPDLRLLDLRTILADVCEDLAPTIDARTATMSIAPGDPVPVYGEPWLCANLFTNLLRNALEALPEQGQTVTITLEASRHQVTAHLTNPGSVPEAIRDTFFQKYATHGKAGGTGLGTYSARLMARAQGGTISLNCSRPGFTTVIVRLPAAKPDIPVEKGSE